MAFTRVNAYLVMSPVALYANLDSYTKETLSSTATAAYRNSGSSYPSIAKIDPKNKTDYVWQTDACCRESLLSTLQTYIKIIAPWLQTNDFKSRIYFRTTTPFSAAVFKRGLELSGINPGRAGNQICALCPTDPSMFWIATEYFDWCKLSVLLYVLRSVDFIKEQEYMTDDGFIKAILRHPEESFPNNSNEPWMATVLAYAVYSRSKGYGYLDSYSLTGYSWFGGSGNGVNSVTLNSIHRDLVTFAKFVKEYKIPDTLINRYLSLPKIPGLKNNAGFLRAILGELTVTVVETSSISVASKSESWDEDSDDDA
jgi:hypothetical protein